MIATDTRDFLTRDFDARDIMRGAELTLDYNGEGSLLVAFAPETPRPYLRRGLDLDTRQTVSTFHGPALIMWATVTIGAGVRHPAGVTITLDAEGAGVDILNAGLVSGQISSDSAPVPDHSGPALSAYVSDLTRSLFA